MSKEKQNDELVQMYRDLSEIFNEEYEKRRLITPQNTAEKMTAKGYRKQSEGEWILHKPRRENRNATYKCSVCGKLCSSYYNDVGEWKCCPHCFAKMKGGEK